MQNILLTNNKYKDPRPFSFNNQNIAGLLAGNFIMQVVDIQAFSVMFAVLFIPDSWSRIYRGILSPLREIL